MLAQVGFVGLPVFYVSYVKHLVTHVWKSALYINSLFIIINCLQTGNQSGELNCDFRSCKETHLSAEKNHKEKAEIGS